MCEVPDARALAWNDLAARHAGMPRVASSPGFAGPQVAGAGAGATPTINGSGSLLAKQAGGQSPFKPFNQPPRSNLMKIYSKSPRFATNELTRAMERGLGARLGTVTLGALIGAAFDAVGQEARGAVTLLGSSDVERLIGRKIVCV